MSFKNSPYTVIFLKIYLPHLCFVKDFADFAVASKELLLFSLPEAFYATTIFLGDIESRI